MSSARIGLTAALLTLVGCLDFDPTHYLREGESVPACASRCVAPAAACKDSSTRVTSRLRACDDSTCQFLALETPCAQGCSDGACLAAPCAGLFCDAAPASTCIDSGGLRAFVRPGSCGEALGCTFDSVDLSCPQGCSEGRCLGFPCIGTQCLVPPPSRCMGTTLVAYDSVGSCSEATGRCEYTARETPCDNGCAAGACVGDACAGVVCDVPPAASCVGTGGRQVFATPGQCSQGACSFVGSSEPCAAGTTCQEGRCAATGAGGGGGSGTGGSGTGGSGTGGSATGGSGTGGSGTGGSGTGGSGTGGGTAVAYGQQAYLKASNTSFNDQFGTSVAISADGDTLAIGTPNEDSAATGVNGNQLDVSKSLSGAVFVFKRIGGVWQQTAYVKASNTDTSDLFGSSVALSADGTTLAVGAPQEGSGAAGIGGNQTDNGRFQCGAAYVFTLTGNTWVQQAYVKPSNPSTYLGFGSAVALSGSGSTLAVSAPGEGNSGTGVNGPQGNSGAANSGAVYVFARSGSTWAQQAYVKASNTGGQDFFGQALALSGDGNTLAVGAYREDSFSATTPDETATDSGAVYVFSRSGTVWAQQSYLKAATIGSGDWFGASVALSDDGLSLAVGAPQEDSAARGIGGNPLDNTFSNSGAAYVFVRAGNGWAQQAYVKASNADSDDAFGFSVALGNGTLVVGAPDEDSDVPGAQGDNSGSSNGAAYAFTRSGTTWVQRAYLKASNTDYGDGFGASVAVNVSGQTLAVAAIYEDSAATGVGGNPLDNSVAASGAVYLFAP